MRSRRSNNHSSQEGIVWLSVVDAKAIISTGCVLDSDRLVRRTAIDRSRTLEIYTLKCGGKRCPPIPNTKDAIAKRSQTKHEHVSVEFWDAGGKPDGYQGIKISKLYKDNSYKALRLIFGDQSFYYSVWCNGEHEFHDMNEDYAQMDNRLAKGFNGKEKQYFGRPEKQLYNRLNAILLVTKGCKGDSCRDPWGVLFPKNQVNGLAEAMKPEYDIFFEKQPNIQFKTCRKGFVWSNEAPHQAKQFGID